MRQGGNAPDRKAAFTAADDWACEEVAGFFLITTGSQSWPFKFMAKVVLVVRGEEEGLPGSLLRRCVEDEN